jgi:hypothetical protein
VSPVLDGVELALPGFVDVGWFDVGGTGAAYRFDHTKPDGTWVYTGDPWAAPIDSQGDAADLGNGFNNLQRDDRIASGGRPTFLVSTVEQGVKLTGEAADAEVALWVEPRGATLGALGDAISVDRAFVTWHPLSGRRLEVEVGKVESPFGLEWWWRRAPDAPGITPSLVARYTVGTPVGVVGRVRVDRDRVELVAAVTNGGTTTERFGHFEDELDTNGVPTGTLRAVVEPVPRLHLGASGQAGAQDGLVEAVPMFQLGADLSLDLPRVYLRAEAVLSDQDQGVPGLDDRLHAEGGYLLAWANVRPWLAPEVRVDRRVADLEVASVGNRYRTDVVRLTAGVAFHASYNLQAKVEGLHLWELLGEPVADDVITTSVVYRW